MPELRGLGIGSLLIAKLEEKIIQRGLKIAIIGVETDNPRAQKLYERLGYKVYDRIQESWEEKGRQGNSYIYHANVVLLKKEVA